MQQAKLHRPGIEAFSKGGRRYHSAKLGLRFAAAEGFPGVLLPGRRKVSPSFLNPVRLFRRHRPTFPDQPLLGSCRRDLLEMAHAARVFDVGESGGG